MLPQQTLTEAQQVLLIMQALHTLTAGSPSVVDSAGTASLVGNAGLAVMQEAHLHWCGKSLKIMINPSDANSELFFVRYVCTLINPDTKQPLSQIFQITSRVILVAIIS